VADRQAAGVQVGGNGRRARGHIEYKTINGCGPYAYLRYWSGQTLKSHYLGKEGGAPRAAGA